MNSRIRSLISLSCARWRWYCCGRLTENGTLIWAQRLTTWGKAEKSQVIASNDPDYHVGCNFRFCGQYEDEESGLYYNRFRYYHPQTGQYLSPDPLNLAGGLNPYGYVHNPANWIDPWGLCGTSTGDSVTVFRVQGGTPPNASYHRIKIDKDGNPKIQNVTLNISIGDAKHAEHFKKIRGDDAELVSFEIPKWFDNFIKENAIKQRGYKTNPLNQGKLAPKIVDPTTPGDSYELPSIWTKWLEENAIPGSGKVKK
ncbi:RHS repeat-associated core domain-containing protein [Xenorhabdus bovienii]|nr:RHS repeat-associated core domain-containing protein [Xenorhabdus bovienii]MDE9553434.1 RHS repeat-associated core domain-containing protein [Xenorhabdus bovienii]MDE9557874.1 RHS repeat-associated core domain-containing protein [Xenorhabdus bovienii]